jgi:F420-0:gamma-glutamyl ligase
VTGKKARGGTTVEVKIGVQQAQRELVVDVDESADEIEKRVSEALASDTGVFTLTDTKGRRVVIPGAKVAYVEIGTGVAGMVGFRS